MKTHARLTLSEPSTIASGWTDIAIPIVRSDVTGFTLYPRCMRELDILMSLGRSVTGVDWKWSW